MTIGEMVKSMLVKLEWFDTRFPRIPVNVQVMNKCTSNTIFSGNGPWEKNCSGGLNDLTPFVFSNIFFCRNKSMPRWIKDITKETPATLIHTIDQLQTHGTKALLIPYQEILLIQWKVTITRRKDILEIDIARVQKTAIARILEINDQDQEKESLNPGMKNQENEDQSQEIEGNIPISPNSGFEAQY